MKVLVILAMRLLLLAMSTDSESFPKAIDHGLYHGHG